jgi:phospholipid/cholesterol/gamma-HCH transport system ATP-binding protein
MIEYKNIYKSFDENEVMKGVDLTVKEGEIFFVLGKTGAGKTVLIRSLVGLIVPDSGSILVDGDDVVGLNDDGFRKIRMKCGMVFQLPTLFDSQNVFENVAFGLRRQQELDEEEIIEKVVESLQRVELDPEIGTRMPDELSFGEQKRVGLARTLVLSPKYLLYDEPTTGLDPFTANRINKLIKHLNKELGTTSIVVSHDLESMLELADRVGFLHEGKFHFKGSVDEFLNSMDKEIVDFKKGLNISGGVD